MVVRWIGGSRSGKVQGWGSRGNVGSEVVWVQEVGFLDAI